MPSPGSTAILMAAPVWAAAEREEQLLVVCFAPSSSLHPFVRSEEPRLLDFSLGLERGDFAGVRQSQADLVQAVEQAVLAKRLDLELERCAAVGCGHRLPLEVDRQPESGKCGDV